MLSKFALTGALVAGTHLGLVTGMVLGGVPIQLALALAYIVALAMHFTLNRQWVFRHESGYALHFSAQGVRYLVAAALLLRGAPRSGSRSCRTPSASPSSPPSSSDRR